MIGEEYRRNYIKNLEIPCHKTFKCYMFYDVLILMCRDICMMEFYPKLRKKAMEKKIKLKIEAKGFEISPETMKQIVR